MDKDKFIPNSYQTPNAYCDEFMYLLTPPEWKVLSYAVRRIFGFQKRQDRISVSQFVHGTVSTIDGEYLDHGTGLSKPTVISCLGSLTLYRLMTKLADNDPVKNEGDLYALQLDYDKVDYAGLVDRANNRAVSDLQRTARGRNSAEQKRRSLPLDLPGQSDLPGKKSDVAVNGIDRRRSMGLTGGGQWDRPGAVNGIDTQYTVGKPEEIQVENTTGLTDPIWTSALTVLKQSLNGTLEATNPRLVAIDENPHKFTVLVDENRPGLKRTIAAAIEQGVTAQNLKRRITLVLVTEWPGYTPIRRVKEAHPAGAQINPMLAVIEAANNGNH